LAKHAATEIYLIVRNKVDILLTQQAKQFFYYLSTEPSDSIKERGRDFLTNSLTMGFTIAISR
jgi:hypothetical protein